jgi:predicted secreted protein
MASTAISAQGSVLQISASTVGSAKTVSAVAVGNPTILTSSAHGFANGDVVTLASFGGAGASYLNGQTVSITNVTTNTFAVQIDTTGQTITVSSSTATPGNWATIANVRTFSGFDGKPSEIDVTNCASTAKEVIVGLVDYGSFSFEIDRDNSDTGQTKCKNAYSSGAAKNFKLTLPDSSTATFNAFVTQFPISGGVDQTVKRSVSLRITGAVTWA